jgi:HD-like signal output (HDOD) protein
MHRCSAALIIVADTLTLPTLPEVAFKIRDKIEGADCSFTDIAGLLAQPGWGVIGQFHQNRS